MRGLSCVYVFLWVFVPPDMFPKITFNRRHGIFVYIP